ncbi:MAG TPA: glycine cleavage system protein GcvH [Gemmataceae bacterium]|nr:glycine cleavage system protein GcvH [Gemmataceae bacterium]
MDPSKLRYTASHEWADVQGGVCTVGITQYAVEQLTDVTHLELPKVGTAVAAGKPFGEIESVKAVFDLNSPVTGTVTERNDAVVEDPALINQDPYGLGWMIRIKLAPGATTDHLMNLQQYEQQIAEGH